MLHNRQKPFGESSCTLQPPRTARHETCYSPPNSPISFEMKKELCRTKMFPQTCFKVNSMWLGCLPQQIIITHVHFFRRMQEAQVARAKCTDRITTPWDRQWNHLTALDVCPLTLHLSQVTDVGELRFRTNTSSLGRCLACSIVERMHQMPTFGNP